MRRLVLILALVVSPVVVKSQETTLPTEAEWEYAARSAHRYFDAPVKKELGLGFRLVLEPHSIK